ncbi:MAG TPA: zeta toxin family protein [Acidimicrobiales bacterium]|nr:zeta toxin family protein [Acidimicrobiales bacterium]
MADPVLHLIAGPNGAGKSTLYDRVIGPVTKLEFVNADVIAASQWPHDVAAHAYDASRLATERRNELIAGRTSFVTETVFSHESKVDLVRAAAQAGYLVMLHVVLVPEDLAVARVANRVENDGHDVPEEKVRSRYARLWSLVAEAIPLVDEATVYDNSSASEPFRVVASFDRGVALSKPAWPRWTPKELRAVT